MTTMAYVLLGLLGIMTVCLVFGAAKLEQQQLRIRREWLHPPEDDDGVSILRDDDPDGECTR